MSNGLWASRAGLSVITWVTYLAFGASTGSIGPILPWLAGRWGVPLDQAGTLFSMLFLGSCATTILGGALLDRVGRKPLLVVLMALMGIGILSLPFAPDLTWGLLATLLMGLGAGGSVALNILVGDLFPRDRGQALNIMGAGFGCGSLAAPLLVGLTTQSAGDPVPALVAAGVLLLLVSLGFALMAFPRRDAPRLPGATEPVVAAPKVWRDSYVLLTGLLLFLYVGIETAFGGWIFSFARQGAGIEAATAGLAATVFWFLFTLGRLSAGIAARWVAVKWLALGGGMVAVLGAGLIALLPGSAMIIFLGAALVGVGFGPIFPTVFGLLTARYAAATGSASSLVALAGSLGGAILPYLTGYLLVASGVGGAAGSVAVGALLVVGLLLALAYAFTTPRSSESSDLATHIPLGLETKP